MNQLEDVLPSIRLQFNIDHPTFEECYGYGYACAIASLSSEDNPYPIGSRLWEQWDEGWHDGFYGEDPLFELDWLNVEKAINEPIYSPSYPVLMAILKISGTLAASAIVGYQLLEWVA